MFEGDLLDELRSVIVDDGPTHAAAFKNLRDGLGGTPPGALLPPFTPR